MCTNKSLIAKCQKDINCYRASFIAVVITQLFLYICGKGNRICFLAICHKTKEKTTDNLCLLVT